MAWKYTALVIISIRMHNHAPNYVHLRSFIHDAYVWLSHHDSCGGAPHRRAAPRAAPARWREIRLARPARAGGWGWPAGPRCSGPRPPPCPPPSPQSCCLRGQEAGHSQQHPAALTLWSWEVSAIIASPTKSKQTDIVVPSKQVQTLNSDVKTDYIDTKNFRRKQGNYMLKAVGHTIREEE